jgi:hypothetical protein
MRWLGYASEVTMDTNKVLKGQIWRRVEAGELYIVTLLYKEVLISYAVLRALNPKAMEANMRARVVKTASGETISGFTIADRL